MDDGREAGKKTEKQQQQNNRNRWGLGGCLRSVFGPIEKEKLRGVGVEVSSFVQRKLLNESM